MKQIFSLIFVLCLLNNFGQTGLVAYFPFDNTFSDESLNGNDLTNENTSFASDRFGNENSAALFNGSTSQLIFPPEFHLGESFTVCGWAYSRSAHYNMGTLFHSDWYRGDWYYEPFLYSVYVLCHNEDGLNCSAFGGNNYVAEIDSERWFFWAISCDGNTLKTYFNGELTESHSVTPNYGTGTYFPARLGRITRNTNAAAGDLQNYWYNGIIDDVRIFDKPLSGVDIESLYTDGGWTGDEQPETGIFTDGRDNSEYGWVRIGKQTWMSDNLNYNSAGSSFYENNSAYENDFGRLYTWEAASNSCPDGWHLPSDAEWQTLEQELGMEVEDLDVLDVEMTEVYWRGDTQGAQMKRGGTSGLDLDLGGYNNTVDFYSINEYGRYWSSTEYNNGSEALNRRLGSDYDGVGRRHNPKNRQFSVRCVKGSSGEPIDINPISEIYSSPIIYKNSKSYFYCSVEQGDELSYLENPVLIPLSSSAGNIPTQMKYMGNGILQFEVGLNSYPELSSFSFELPSQVTDLSGTTINFLSQPLIRNFDLADPEVEQEIDLYGGGSLGLKFTAGSLGLGPSISAAALSVEGSAGMGMTFTRKKDGDQFITRRVELGVAAGLSAPEVSAVVGSVDVFSFSEGLTGTVKQKMRYPATLESDLVLKAKAYSILETFSLGGIELSPMTGMFIMALNQALLNKNPDLQDIYQDLYYSTSIGVSKEVSLGVDLSFKLLDSENCKLSLGEAGINTSFGLGIEESHQNNHLNFEATLAAGYDAGLFNFEFFNAIETGSILGAEGGCEININADFVKGEGINSLGLALKTTTTAEILILDYSIWNEFKFDIPKSVIDRNLQSDNLIGLVSPFFYPAYDNQRVSLQPGSLAEYLDYYIDDTPVELMSLDEYVRFSHQQSSMKGVAADLKIDLTVAAGLGLGVKMGIEFSYFDELSYPLNQYAIVKNKLLPVYKFDGLSKDDRIFTLKDEMYDLLYGVAELIEDPLKGLENKIEDVIEAGKLFTMVAFNQTVQVAGALSKAGTFILRKIPSSLKRTRKSAFMDPQIINAYTSRKVITLDGYMKSTAEQSTLYIISDHYDASMVDANGDIILDFDSLNMSIAVNMGLVNELEFSMNDLEYARMYYYDFDNLTWVELEGDLNTALDTVECRISKSGTYAIGINNSASMDDDPVEILDYYPSNLQTIQPNDTVWIKLRESVIGSGINFERTQILIDGIPVETEWHPVTGVLKYVSDTPFEDGEHSFSVDVYDNYGNYSTVYSAFKIESLNVDYSLVMNDIFSFGCYPNPASDVVYIEINNPDEVENADISIFNARGELIHILFEGEIQAGLSTFELTRSHKDKSGLDDGIYFIRYRNGRNNVVKKVVFN